MLDNGVARDHSPRPRNAPRGVCDGRVSRLRFEHHTPCHKKASTVCSRHPLRTHTIPHTLSHKHTFPHAPVCRRGRTPPGTTLRCAPPCVSGSVAEDGSVGVSVVSECGGFNLPAL